MSPNAASKFLFSSPRSHGALKKTEENHRQSVLLLECLKRDISICQIIRHKELSTPAYLWSHKKSFQILKQNINGFG
jgi:hypothetical protein